MRLATEQNCKNAALHVASADGIGEIGDELYNGGEVVGTSSVGTPHVVNFGAMRYTAVGDAATERLVARVLEEISGEIRAIGLEKLAGVYLGGGYGRGEGGAPLYNDLDFFVLTDGASEAEKDAITRRLGELGARHSRELGVDVDFCRAKNELDFKKVERRLMIQEFLQGFVPVYGSREALDFLKRFPAGQLPVTEALRLLVNRGMGLLLARKSDDPDFVRRNINKAVLGAGDARLIMEGRYAWKALERAALLDDRDYDRALEFKFRPVCQVATWELGHEKWLREVRRLQEMQGRAIRCPAPRHALRWLARRHTVGSWRTFGMDPLYRILLPLERQLAGNGSTAMQESLMKDWSIFN